MRRAAVRPLLQCSRRAAAPPPVVELMVERYLRPGVTNLAVGLPHWSPPSSVMPAPTAADARYGACEGDSALLQALREVESENASLQEQYLAVQPALQAASAEIAQCKKLVEQTATRCERWRATHA